jgi:hypothetical protein
MVYPFLIVGGILALGGAKYVLRVMRTRAGLNSLDLASPRAKRYSGPFESPMTRREAFMILGVRESMPEDKILSAHKKLMLLNHPDNGGSTFLATKINEAKDIILKR